MRRVPAFPVAACLAFSALALSAGAAAAANGELGGGFIELLLTGSAGPTTFVARPAMSSPIESVQAPEQAAAPEPAPQVAALAPSEPRRRRRRVPPPGGRLFRPRGARHDRHRHAAEVPVPGRTWRARDSLWRRRRPARLRMGGVKTITRKAEWPGWTPPSQMMLRRPDLPAHMDGGPDNPLGARALYLGSSLYRIHGTNEPRRSAATFRPAASG